MTLRSEPYLEIIRSRPNSGRIRHTLFDFDGTVSLIRQGWQQVMQELMVETLQATPSDEDEETLRNLAADLIRRTTGQATIDQMAHLAQAVKDRGGSAQAPEAYKARFLARLTERIERRLDRLMNGRLSAEALTVPGAPRFLSALTARDVTCSLASGTDHDAVVREIGLLGLASYFDDRIYGARSDDNHLSKGDVINKIKRENGFNGPDLAVIGDGGVEIAEAKAAGAVAVGVASDEIARQGVDQEKRASLIAAGADLIIPDFSQAELLLAYLGFDTEMDAAPNAPHSPE